MRQIKIEQQQQGNNSTQFGITQSTYNKDEVKLKMLLSGSYDFIHRETGKMIQKKQYRKAFRLLEQYNQIRKDLQLAELIQLNRRILTCVNKTLKSQLAKSEGEQKSEEYSINLVTRGTMALYDLYKYLNLFINKIIVPQDNHLVLKDISHLTISMNDIAIMPKKIITLNQNIHQYDQQTQQKVKIPKPQTLQSHLDIIEQNEIEGDRIAEIIQRNEKPLDIKFELEQMWQNVLQILLLQTLIYKKSNKPKLIYLTLQEADRLSQQLIHSNNSNIVNLCAQVNIMLGNFYFECGNNQKALNQYDKALIILTGELLARQNMQKYISKDRIDIELSLHKKCIKTILQALFLQATIYESMNSYQNMMEVLNITQWIAEKFIPGLDEQKKLINKLQIMAKVRLDPYFAAVSDLSHLAQLALEDEIKDLNKISLQNKKSYEETYLQQFHDQMFNLFQVKELNKLQAFKIKNIQPIDTKKQQKPISVNQNTKNYDHKLDFKSPSSLQQNHMDSVNQATEMSLNLIDSDDSSTDQSFFEPNVLDPTQNKFILNDTKYTGIIKNTRTSKQQTQHTLQIQKSQQTQQSQIASNKQKRQFNTKGLKSVGLIKLGMERSPDHKSRILTTNNYFKNYQAKLQNNQTPTELSKLPFQETVDDAIKKYQRALQNIDYREHPDTMSKSRQDLDIYVGKVVQDQIGDGQFLNYDTIKPVLNEQRKQEYFDKKEFQFGQSMLQMKKREMLGKNQQQEQQYQPIFKIGVETNVHNEAYTIDQQISVNKEVQEMRKRKIEMMVANKQKLNQGDFNLDDKDPNDANFWKQVINKTKKKTFKELVLKYHEQLGLKKFYANIMREQKENEKQQKLKEKELSQSKIDQQTNPKLQNKLQDNSPTTEPIDQSQKKKPIVQILDKPVDQFQTKSLINNLINPKKIKKNHPKLNTNQSEQSNKPIYSDMTKQEKQIIVQKHQKKAHQVISMILDGVEKKIQQENKELNKLKFFQNGGKLENYPEEDGKTYLKFVNKMGDLIRTTHLQQIKRELNQQELDQMSDHK